MASFMQLLAYESCVPEDELSWKSCMFPDHESCHQFYKSYAKRLGFKTRIQRRGKLNTKGEAIDSYTYLRYVCNKSGYRKNSALNPAKPQSVDSINSPQMQKVKERSETRCGCPAEIRFHRVPNLDCFRISEWISGHNHPLHPENQVHLLDCEISDAQATLAERHAQVGIPIRQSYQLFSRVAGGDVNVGFRPIDLKNYLSSKRQLRLQHGEGTSLLEYFRDEAIKKPNYFYSVQVDSEEQIASIFWADGIMRADYAAFGDVLSFDTTFRTNNLYRPLG